MMTKGCGDEKVMHHKRHDEGPIIYMKRMMRLVERYRYSTDRKQESEIKLSGQGVNLEGTEQIRS
jgi:hypothetical protein